MSDRITRRTGYQGRVVAGPITSPPTEPDVPIQTDLSELPSIEPPDDDSLVHLGRHPFKHAFCGVECDPESRGRKPASGSKERDCETCHSIAKAHIEGGGWEGYGKRPPGKDITVEIRRLLEERS